MPYGLVPAALRETGRTMRDIIGTEAEGRVSKAQQGLEMTKLQYGLGKDIRAERQRREQLEYDRGMDAPTTPTGALDFFVSTGQVTPEQKETMLKSPMFQLLKDETTMGGGRPVTARSIITIMDTLRKEKKATEEAETKRTQELADAATKREHEIKVAQVKANQKDNRSALRKRFDEYKASNPDYKGKVLDYLKLEKEAEKTGKSKGLQRKTRTRRLESGAVETQEYDYDPNAGEEVGESSPWVTTGKESDPGVSKRREFLTAKDLAKTEELILANPENESVTGHLELFNSSSETPYMYIWGDVPGTIYGTNPGTQRIDLPKMNGRQVTAADVMKTAEEEGMTPEEVLIHIGVIEQEDGT